MNYDSPYFAEGFLPNVRLYFDIAFVQFIVISRINNKLVEIVAVAECYLIVNHVKKYQRTDIFRICLPVKLADGRISVKKEKNYSHWLNLQHFQFGQDG